MTHPSLSDLALYAGRDCGVIERWRVNRHLRTCDACRNELRAQESAREALREYAAEMPAGVNWDRLAEEMKGNIRVGLAAGECVGDFPVKRRPALLHWNIATSMAMLVLLFAAAFIIDLPSESRRIADLFRPVAGRERPRPTPVIMSAAPGSVLEASPQQIAIRANGTALSVIPADSTDMTVSLSMQGSASARTVDADTGEVTISRVYDAQ